LSRIFIFNKTLCSNEHYYAIIKDIMKVLCSNEQKPKNWDRIRFGRAGKLRLPKFNKK